MHPFLLFAGVTYWWILLFVNNWRELMHNVVNY